MERNLRLNWPALVEEARTRRKTQRLTQRRFAAIADVSTPTVSRFERGDQNIKLASALAILEVLDMVDRPALTFPDKAQRYLDGRDVVVFPALNREGREVACAISGEALVDHFGTRGRSRRVLSAAFRNARAAIEGRALEKYEGNRIEPDGSVLVRTSDVRLLHRDRGG